VIGVVAVALTVLCAVGLVALRVFRPAGQHRAARGRHRDRGETHAGAGSTGHAEELATLRLAVDNSRRQRDEGDEGDGDELADLFADNQPPDKGGAA
jgi:hypothetical protein